LNHRQLQSFYDKTFSFFILYIFLFIPLFYFIFFTPLINYLVYLISDVEYKIIEESEIRNHNKKQEFIYPLASYGNIQTNIKIKEVIITTHAENEKDLEKIIDNALRTNYYKGFDLIRVFIYSPKMKKIPLDLPATKITDSKYFYIKASAEYFLNKKGLTGFYPDNSVTCETFPCKYKQIHPKRSLIEFSPY
jgi:hypothetical protein